MRISRKIMIGFVVVLSLALVAWTVPSIPPVKSTPSAAHRGDNEQHPGIPSKVNAPDLISNKGDLQLQGYLAKIPGVQARINEINSYQVDMSKISTSNVSDLDNEFISDALTSNSLELWSIEYSLRRGVHDPNLRDFLLMMLAMHSTDQKTAVAIAQKLGMDTTVDFVNSSVYPETPAYDLGVRTENLKQDYLDHLVERAKVSFDEVSLDILDREHASDIQGEMAAERETSNPEIKALTKHSADVTGLHMMLMDVLSAHISTGYDEAPQPEIKENYMSPRQITVEGASQSQ